jgi:hypothetical protein|eukprot:TRINITY_DN1463_c0_g2_i1.p2 TRINITY_DN1463_c0_g2~~TRINITY_DN1463_c0_g2_i1.p2  ORF type:complete len:119 (-),score=3.16 TRINITY_DN1463_c0_g2_i1:521-877(-)
MMILLLLASISRCAVAELCPSDSEIVAAARARDNAFVQAVSDQASADNPGEIFLIHTQRIKNIDNVICGDQIGDESATITCKFTIRYWSQNAYVVAKMVNRDNHWEIADELRVMRDRN